MVEFIFHGQLLQLSLSFVVVADNFMLNNFIKDVHFRISMIGKLPICNQKCERAPIIQGLVFIFCYRCTGIIVGGIITTICKYFELVNQSYALLLLFTLPCFLDGFMQKINIIQSNNLRRIITGLLFGIGLAFLQQLYAPLQHDFIMQ